MLANTSDFAAHTLDATGAIRPWGPGIMLESVLYTCIYLGFKQIITVGWDIADNRSSNHHFYDTRSLSSSELHSLPSQNSRQADPFLYNYLRHISRLRYNVIRPFNGEANLVFNCLSNLKKFLVFDNNIDFVCISDSHGPFHCVN